MRFLGVNIPDQKRVEASLTYIYGIGPAASRRILKEAKLSPDLRTKDLTTEQLNQLKNAVEKGHRIEGELRQLVRQNIDRLKTLQTYRGLRHARHLPVRGQRTKSNSRTAHGNVRKTAGSGKRKVDLK
jgi:small subunit ribosomal protein S13